MKGYLIYDGSNVIGWCNADQKMNYRPVLDSDDYNTPSSENDNTIVLYCLEIAPDYRGKGIAHFIVDSVCEAAKKMGYRYVESFPFIDEEFAYQYRGPLKLYEKHGFEKIDKKSGFYVMRKEV